MISLSTLRAAADRQRRGDIRAMDAAICDAPASYTESPAPVPVASVYDLPIAKRMWRADGRRVER